LKFNPPPGWPLPWDFEPSAEWEPDPSWPPPPPGWPMWIGSGAPKVLYQAPNGAAYVPGYMRESLPREPSARRRRQFRWPSAKRRLARRGGGTARRGHRRRSRAPGSGEQIALVVVGLVASGFIAFEALGPGIKDPSHTKTANTANHSRQIDLLALPTGACFQDSPQGHPGSAATVTALPCTLAHNAQIFARFPARDVTYPGRTALQRRGIQHCRSAVADRLDGSKLAPGMSVIDVVPSHARWSSGIRTISCVVVDPAARWTKSLLRAHHGRKLSGHDRPLGSPRGSAGGQSSASRRRGARQLGPRGVATRHGQPRRRSRRAHSLSM
jgi:hypothetical protein